MEQLFGKSYQIVGDTDNDLLLKAKGQLKAQLGNQFVDLICLFRGVPTDGGPNGIYINGSDIYLMIDGIKKQL